MRYLIVGGSAAGMAAAHTIRKEDRSGVVTVLSNEKAAPYFRPMIPYIITGQKTPEDIALEGRGIFTRNSIDVETDCAATALDAENRVVKTARGRTFSYDKILVAAGSRPYMPETINGLDAPGVFALKTLQDATGMAQRARTAERAVMLGGGILNLKAAFALLERKIRVTLVVYSPEVLSQLMDPEDAFLIRAALERAGLEIITGCAAAEVIADGDGVRGVALDNGKELACQMICVGKGVIPNTDFLEGQVNIDKGVVTDEYTAGSMPDVYAAGDAAVVQDPGTGEKTVTALWTNAVEMGICAGLNMAGRKTRYAGTLGIMNATQAAGVPFVAMGTVHTRDKDLEVHLDRTASTFRKIVFDPAGERLVGALFIGDITRAGMYRCLIRERMPVARFKDRIIDHDLHYGHFLS